MGQAGSRQQALQGYSYTHVAANGTTIIIGAGGTATQIGDPAGAKGLFAGVSINSPGSSWTLTVYDGTVAQNIVIAVITASQYAPPSNFPLQLQNGLTIVAAGTTAGSVTVAWL